jgi:CubicO group peptidase (beta-lactamase class C family)
MHPHPIDHLMNQGLRENVFPGAVLLVGRGDQPLFFKSYGSANLFAGLPMTRQTVFDLASLTKPLATTLAVARLVDQEQIVLDRPILRWMPALAGSDKATITTRQLLCHQSGLPAHDLFYMTLKSISAKMRKAVVLDLLKSVPLENPPGVKHRYSDLGFMLLCRLVETVSGCSMDHFLRHEIYDPMGLDDLFFVDLTGSQRPFGPYAATELCPLRNRLLVGEVHDDNAWFAGGIDGHAGLFGSAEAVFRLLRYVVADFRCIRERTFFSQKILSEIFHGVKSNPLPMGFDRPSVENSSAGRYFSTNTVGHLGFTGVSFWMDLDKDVTVILFTNRVHPFRWNTRLVQFRPRIHDRIMEHFEI